MDLFATTALNRVIEQLPVNPCFLLNQFFPFVETSDTESIFFDVVNGRRRISPFVAYNVKGQVVDEIGFESFAFKPAYIKDKRVFDPNKQFKRTAGERLGGELTPEQRLASAVRFALADQLDMFQRRLEVMAAEVLFTGKAVIVGEKYPKKVVDFLRDPRLRVVLTGGDKWNVNGVDPFADIARWRQTVYDISKTKPTDVLFTLDVWEVIQSKVGEINPANGQPTTAARLMAARFSTDVARLDSIRLKLNPLVLNAESADLVGVTSDGLRMWVYNDAHEVPDPAHPELPGEDMPNLPAGSVLLASTAVEGTRFFGAVRDLKAGIQPKQFFVKSWEEEDPSVRFILGQSAPLLVPYRKNGTLAATVL